MGLIKSANTPASLSPFSMRDIEMHAKSILLRAQQQADQLLSAAQMEAVSLKEQARIEGLQEGKQAGTVRGLKEGNAAGQAQALQEHRAALTAAVTALGGAMQELDVSRRALESEALTDVIELAVSIARRVTKRQAMFDPQVLIDNLNEAMKLVVHSADLRIAIHPAQQSTLTDALPKLGIEWPSLEHAAIVEDSTLHPGGIRIFTRQGRVEADIDDQLDRVIAEVLPDRPRQGGA